MVDGGRTANMWASHRFGGARSGVPAGLLLALGLASAACAPDGAAPVDTRIAAATAPDVTGSGNLDLLFLIDDSSEMPVMQNKFVDQVPVMLNVLQSLPMGLPNIHVAVISSDMGAPGDSPDKTGCTQAGDQGTFQAQPRGTCTDSTLTPGATFISNANGVINYTASSIADVVRCILPLGGGGCQFEHPLASMVRALGADGAPAPASNAGFLRPDAMLAIVILTNQDDCSAPPNTGLYSLGDGPDNLVNSFGQLTTYRCNEFGHLCVDPHSNNPVAPPPETTPADAQGTSSAPTVNLADCQSNETGLLTSVGTFVDEIRALKPDPDHQIVVGAIVAPSTPYTVAWVPGVGGQDAASTQLWPQVEHSCGPPGASGTNPTATELPTDGSFGDPGVRLAQFVAAFGSNGLAGSVCDASYATVFQPLGDLIATNVPLSSIGVTGTTGDGGAGTANVGGSGVTGVGGAGALPGTGVGTLGGRGGAGGGVHGSTGLRSGGCSVGASAPGASGPAALVLVLALASARCRRRWAPGRGRR
jgi:hypothetical protein